MLRDQAITRLTQLDPQSDGPMHTALATTGLGLPQCPVLLRGHSAGSSGAGGCPASNARLHEGRGNFRR